MNDSRFMGTAQGFRNFNTDTQRFGKTERSRSQLVGQTEAIDELHRDAGHPIELSGCINLASVRMVNAGSELGFANEALPPNRVFLERRGQYFKGDLPPQRWVFGQIHLSHA